MNFREGDIIKTKKWNLYWHYGIYAGDDQVIHYSCYPCHVWDFYSHVVKTDMSIFYKHGGRIEICYRARNRYEGEKILGNAYARLGEEKYSFLTNNCQHFALSCISFSIQQDGNENWDVQLSNGGDS